MTTTKITLSQLTGLKPIKEQDKYRKYIFRAPDENVYICGITKEEPPRVDVLIEINMKE